MRVRVRVRVMKASGMCSATDVRGVPVLSTPPPTHTHKPPSLRPTHTTHTFSFSYVFSLILKCAPHASVAGGQNLRRSDIVVRGKKAVVVNSNKYIVHRMY